MSNSLLVRRFVAPLAIVLLTGSAPVATAQVKHVEMHIAGYLCGN